MGPNCCHCCCSFPHNQHNRTSILITLLLAATALSCTVLTFDPYAALMGVGATGFLIATTCTPISAAGFIVAGIMAWAAALMSAMNLVSIALTSVCDDDDTGSIDDLLSLPPPPSSSSSSSSNWEDGDNTTGIKGMNATYTVNHVPGKNETTVNTTTITTTTDDSSLDDTDDGDYTFFCTYRHFFLVLTIVATILWMATGKFTLDMSYQQASRSRNNDRWNDSGEETVAMEEDEQDDDFTESCIMEQGEINSNQETVENEDDIGTGDTDNDTRNNNVPSSQG